MTTASSSPRSTNSPRPKKKVSRRALYVSGAVLAVIVIAVAVVGYLAFSKLSSARDDLNLASTNASDLRAALTAGDRDKARSELARMQGNVRSAQSSLDSSILSATAKVPLIGKNVTAVRTITDAVSDVADKGLPPLVEVADKFNAKTFNPQGGKINTAALSELTPSLTAAAASIRQADDRIQSVDASSLIGRLQGPVTDAQEQVGDAASIADRAAVASRVLPQMLTGQHTYLLIFQNNAEIRATGGLPGSYAGLQVDNGSIKLVGQGAGGDLGGLKKSAATLTPAEKELFGDNLVRDFRDVNFTPDFPRAAEIASAIIKQEKGTTVDGVISLDPVTLSYLLKGIGPVTLSDGTKLTSENAVDVLLNNVYVTYTGKAQDTFFEAATQQIFDKVISGAGDPTTVLKALTKATDERRVSVWVKDKTINDEIAGTALAHELPTGDQASPAVGFYLNDATGAKMQYYLRTDLTGRATTCTDAGVQDYTSELTLRSTAPADASALPEAIRGPGFGAIPGTMIMNLLVYGPTDGKITSISFDGKKTKYFQQLDQDGRPVAVVPVQVNPGQTVKVGAEITSGTGQKGSTSVDSTPSIVSGASTQTWRSAC